MSHTAEKTRRIRKGTRSCWECKHRKVRCIFASPEASTCNNCRRRRSQCLTQEVPEEVALASRKDGSINERMQRMEAFVESLARGQSPPQPTPTYLQTPASTVDDSSINAPISSSSSSNEKSSIPSPISPVPKHLLEYTHRLQAAFPPAEELDILCSIMSQHKVYFHLNSCKPYRDLQHGELPSFQLPRSSAELLDPNAHPVLLGRAAMLLAANFNSQQLYNVQGISEPARFIGRRMAQAITANITSQTELNGSLEYLQCCIFEALMHINCGNLRKTWFSVRHSLAVAQSMGLHKRSGTKPQRHIPQLDPTDPIDPEYMWYQVVTMDRHLSLLLGFAQGSTDLSMASEEALRDELPMGRLQRWHSCVASRILERNTNQPTDHFDITTQIDAELLRVSREMPSKFWLPPDFHHVKQRSEADFWETQRVTIQIYHFHLINQTHLPYLLRFDPAGSKHDYSKMSCTNASREILTRFIAYRRFQGDATCHRALEFLALMAAMTLILAHLDSHLHLRQEQSSRSILAHQRIADRAMVERVLETMETTARLSDDALSEQSGTVLDCLLRIEDEAASGDKFTAQRYTSDHDIAARGYNVDQDGSEFKALRICIPYFGAVTIAKDKQQAAETSTDASMQVNDSLGQIESLMAQGGSWEQQDLGAMIAGLDYDAFEGIDVAFFGSLMNAT